MDVRAVVRTVARVDRREGAAVTLRLAVRPAVRGLPAGAAPGTPHRPARDRRGPDGGAPGVPPGSADGVHGCLQLHQLRPDGRRPPPEPVRGAPGERAPRRSGVRDQQLAPSALALRASVHIHDLRAGAAGRGRFHVGDQTDHHPVQPRHARADLADRPAARPFAAVGCRARRPEPDCHGLGSRQRPQRLHHDGPGPRRRVPGAGSATEPGGAGHAGRGETRRGRLRPRCSRRRAAPRSGRGQALGGGLPAGRDPHLAPAPAVCSADWLRRRCC